ncbi:hypothetical protein D1007_10124 [Hordeum vulgare]|nr:hypothetical protein D1007_10124 [Hordeum vulgare]
MATTTPGGGDVAGGYGDLPGLGVDDHVGLAVDDGGYSSNHSSDAGSEEDRVKMAEIWVANPSSSHHWTSGAGGGMILNDDVWELRIHFDSQPNINMELCSSDVTFLNLYAVLQTQDEEHDWLLFEDDDDGHDPPSFVLPKGRKSRAKKRKPRIWYNDRLEHPHQQLFIKGEKTFAIKKMRLEHTCPTNTEKSRISAKWLAKTYESLFRSDPSTSINTLMDNCRENYGVDVGRHMAYRAKNLVVEAVLGEHKKQYPRLRDYAHTIMDTNPGSRVVVTTITSKPTTKIPHPTPRFHAMFFCINGAGEGFLNGSRPFIG